MRRIHALVAGALLAGPGVLAFFSGGYFERARLWALIVAGMLLGLVALLAPDPRPRRPATWAAVGGLVLLAAWIGLSISWAPQRGLALEDLERVLLYACVLAASAVALREPRAGRAVEPVLAAGATVAVLYGISERLLPGLVSLSASLTGEGRLEQPLSYHNAMGLLAALGIVLVVRIAGDPTRAPWGRTVAAAATPVLALGLFLTLSRAGLGVALAGLALLVLLVRTRPQLEAAALAVGAGLPLALSANWLDAVRTRAGTLAEREHQGLEMLVILVVFAGLAAAIVALRATRAGPPPRRYGLPRGTMALVVVVLALAPATVVVATSAGSNRNTEAQPTSAATARRLASLDSTRYDVWRVALRGFGAHPVRGTGSSGFETLWREERPRSGPLLYFFFRDAHSLYLEMLAELGLVGFALLALWLGGVGAAALAAYRRDPDFAAGPIAAIAVWAIHAELDWDWEMPGVTLVALVLAGALIARVERAEPGRPATRAAPVEASEADAVPVRL